MFPVLLLLAACGGSGSPSTTPEPAKSPAPAAAPAPTPAPAPAAEVGPDGPESVPLPADLTIPTDSASVAEGEKVFAAKGCGGCHAFGSKLVGPDLTGVTERRSVKWVARMIQHPETMIKEDPVAKKLYAEAMTPMANQQVTDAEVVKLIAYLQTKK